MVITGQITSYRYNEKNNKTNRKYGKQIGDYTTACIHSQFRNTCWDCIKKIEEQEDELLRKLVREGEDVVEEEAEAEEDEKLR